MIKSIIISYASWELLLITSLNSLFAVKYFLAREYLKIRMVLCKYSSKLFSIRNKALVTEPCAKGMTFLISEAFS